MVKSYQELVVWEKSMELVERVYRMTKVFPAEEMYGLSSQLRRAAVSVPSNIAEGQARRSKAEFLRFLSIAQGSRAEVETQTLIAERLGYVSKQQISEIVLLLEEIAKMLHTLRAKLTTNH
ncbi:four helix bundle protein [Halochromatium roseum]|uniref:four helix bundle protein n=1 Tax=Halochromatium roseum TaxID=391920 RepID=UPI0019116C82|nr:four helix bundle protein [Halochromatium roseum]MBK5938203.1 four helix bundle protein [Halochromatium roseum]